MELLRQFPSLWMIIGFAIASAAFIYANKKVFAWQREATENLVRTLRGTITSLTAERDDYRNTLHAVRNNLGTELSTANLRIKELELRPDITALFQASQDFYKTQTELQSKQASAMQQLIDSINKHDEDVERRMLPVYDGLKTMGKGIEELLRRTQRKLRTPKE